MDGQRRFAVIGTDARLAAAGRALARAGFAVGGPEQTALADYILLPLPLDESRTPLAELLRAAKPGALALGGKLSAQARQIAAEAGVELVDYFAREELILCNAIPTAEGCIGILMAERTRTLWNSAILLAGFGPVGQALGVRLAALGAQVTVAARRPAQRALAESFGLRAVDLARLEHCRCRWTRAAPRWRSCCGPQNRGRWRWAESSRRRQGRSRRRRAWSWWTTLPGRN